MICNSVPYDVPTREIRPYLGLKAEELVDKMAEVCNVFNYRSYPPTEVIYSIPNCLCLIDRVICTSIQ